MHQPRFGGPAPTSTRRRAALWPAMLCALLALHGAAQAAFTPPTGAPRAPLAAATGPAWWQGFRDPGLDTLMRAALAGLEELPQVRAAAALRVGSRYVTARGLAARLVVARDLQRALADQRRWAVQGGPTPQGAAELAEIDRAAASLDTQIARGTERRSEALADLRAASGLPAPMLERLLQPTLADPAVPRYRGAGLRDDARLAPPEAGSVQTLAWQAARVRALEQDAQALSTRLASGRRALQARRAHPREVLGLYQQLLLETDEVLQAQAALATAWFELMADRP